MLAIFHNDFFWLAVLPDQKKRIILLCNEVVQLFTRPLLPVGSSLQVEILSVIASIFPIYGLQIIPESCQTPHIIYHWKEDDISDDKDNDKDTQTNTKTKTKTNTKCLKDPSHAILLKSREFKDIRYNAYNDKYNDQDKDDDKDKDKDKDNDKYNEKYKDKDI